MPSEDLTTNISKDAIKIGDDSVRNTLPQPRPQELYCALRSCKFSDGQSLCYNYSSKIKCKGTNVKSYQKKINMYR